MFCKNFWGEYFYKCEYLCKSIFWRTIVKSVWVCILSILHMEKYISWENNCVYSRRAVLDWAGLGLARQVRSGQAVLLCFAMVGSWMFCFVFHAMLCYAMLCYAMLCYAMLCYAMLCYAMLCYAMLCYAMLCYAFHAMLCYAIECFSMLSILCHARKGKSRLG